MRENQEVDCKIEKAASVRYPWKKEIKQPLDQQHKAKSMLMRLLYMSRAVLNALNAIHNCETDTITASTEWSRFYGIHALALFCGEGNGTPLQYSCLENSMDGGAW